MDKQTYERGLEIRKSVLGKEFVEKAIASADDFDRPLQELVTEYCWARCGGARASTRRRAASSTWR
jgi:4-carboxymuconolactone decarboxylase